MNLTNEQGPLKQLLTHFNENSKDPSKENLVLTLETRVQAIDQRVKEFSLESSTIQARLDRMQSMPEYFHYHPRKSVFSLHCTNYLVFHCE